MTALLTAEELRGIEESANGATRGLVFAHSYIPALLAHIKELTRERNDVGLSLHRVGMQRDQAMKDLESAEARRDDLSYIAQELEKSYRTMLDKFAAAEAQVKELTKALEEARRDAQTERDACMWAERAEASEHAVVRLREQLSEETLIVDRIWAIFGRPSYDALAGHTIYDLVIEAKDRAETAERQNAVARRELEEADAAIVNYMYDGASFNSVEQKIEAALARHRSRTGREEEK